MERFAGRYALLRTLGSGGMGTVHLALDLSAGREVAIKRLHAQASAHAPDTLRHEFDLLARVRHPAVVEVFELGQAPDGSLFYTMEYVPGPSSEQAIRPGEWRPLSFVAAQVVSGLEALHAAGIVHGDLKPANVLVLQGEGAGAMPAGVRVLDFGLAALLGASAEGHRGTPGFAAPEVVRGDRATVASDLYGLGATLYALATGHPAFMTGASRSALRRQQGGPPSAVPLEEAGMPGPFVQLILRLMAPTPAERPRDAREVRAELERIEPGVRRALGERLQTEIHVGRERELAQIDRWLARGADAPGVLRLTGAPGMGRSALLRQIELRATLSGRPVMRLACAPFEGLAPLAGALARRIVVDEPEGTTAPLAALEARRWLEREDTASPDSRGGVLADAIAHWAKVRVKDGLALLVLLDDVQHLHPLALDFVRMAAFHPEGHAIRWVWTERDGGAERGDGTGNEPLDRLATDAERVEPLALGPLDAASTSRLAAARLHQEPPAELAAILWAQSGGHPGLVVELLRLAAERGAVADSEVGITTDAERLRELSLPPDYEASLLRRLATLPVPARRAAIALAVWDRPADAAETGALAPGDDDALEVLRAAGFAERDASRKWRLCPPALATPITESLAPAERCALHRAALAVPGLPAAERFRHLCGAGDAREALAEAERAYASRADHALAARAASLAESESPAQAALWHERAGQALHEMGRHLAAIVHLERAVELTPPGAGRAKRWRFLSAAYLRAAQPAEVGRVVERALAEDPSAAERALLLSNEAARLRVEGRFDLALAAATRALASAEESSDDEALGFASLTLAGNIFQTGRFDEAESLAHRAHEYLERCGNLMGATRALGQRAFVALLQQEPARAEQLYRQALEIATTHGLRLAGEEVGVNLATLLLQSGRWAEATQAAAECLRTSLVDGRGSATANAMVNLAVSDGLMGHSRRALRRARAAVRLTRAFARPSQAAAWRSLAQARRISGQPAAALRAARRALAHASELKWKPETEWSHIECARLYALAGRWTQAGEIARAAAAPGADPDSIGSVILATFIARSDLRRGDPDAAEQRLAGCVPWLSGRAAPYAGAHVLQARAELAFSRGDAREGLRLAQQSHAAFAALPAPSERAAAAVDFARMAMAGDAGARAPIAEWLHEAAGTFERLGDHPGRERALALRWSGGTARAGPRRRCGRITSTISSSRCAACWIRSRTSRADAARHAAGGRAARRRARRAAAPGRGHGSAAPDGEHGAVDAATRDRAVGYSRRVVERVAHSGGSVLIGDAATDPQMRSESVVDLRLQSILCVPMYVGGHVVGAVYLDDSRRPDAFSVDDRRLLEGFAQLMAVAFEKSRGQEEVRRANEQLVGENMSLRRQAGERFQSQNFVAVSEAMQSVLAVVDRAAQTAATVLLTGENGTGKELIALMLHHGGRRQKRPFVAVNCGAIPETLLESELFGILPNVATDVRGRDGHFVQANSGTLFLDEIGEMPLKQQVALLSVLTSREVTPVGGGPPIQVDVRIIAATNRDLRRLVEEGSFREDLFYRLNVMPIEVPPLRDRKADIPALAEHFAGDFAAQQEREVPQLSPELLAALMQSDWPGNVRELQNYIERIMAITPGTVLLPDPLPRDLESRPTRLRLDRGRKLADIVDEVERKLIREAMARSGGNQSRAARELGLTEQSLRYRLRKQAAEETRRNRRIRRNRRK